jgi:hypothetical protein
LGLDPPGKAFEKNIPGKKGSDLIFLIVEKFQAYYTLADHVMFFQ